MDNIKKNANGQDAIIYNAETGTPWHKKGTKVDGPMTLEVAETIFPFEYRKETLYLADGTPITTHDAITINDTNTIMGIGGIDYLSKEFIFNKGPDDYGAQMHAQAVIVHTNIVKERPTAWRIIRFLSYDRDLNTPATGMYRFSYEVSGQKGTILCHYDRASGGFNHDEILPDK